MGDDKLHEWSKTKVERLIRYIRENKEKHILLHYQKAQRLADVRAAGGDAVAMANAMPSVKAAASVVGPSNSDDGVGEAVRHFVFGQDSQAFQPTTKL